MFTVYLYWFQVELENWVNSIHSACAAAFARHRGKTGTLHLLQEEIFRLEKAIETVSLNFVAYATYYSYSLFLIDSSIILDWDISIFFLNKIHSLH